MKPVEIPDANEAYETAKPIEESRNRRIATENEREILKEFERCKRRVNNGLNNGYYSANCSYQLLHHHLEYFENKGYSVEYKKGFYSHWPPYYRISWNKEDN